MRIFIFEHTRATARGVATRGVAMGGAAAPGATAGGNGASSSSGFRGDIMLRSLLADISSIAAIDVVRPQSSAPEHDDEAIDDCIAQADAVWPLAPESHGVLESISRKTTQYKKILLGSTEDAVRAATSKHDNSLTLQSHGIPAVPTYRANASLPSDPHGWVVKPDDGAGCSDTHIFQHARAATEWVAAHPHGDYVLQPYITGRPCNLSLLCQNGEVLLMACNDLRVAVSDNQFHYMGSIVNSLDDAHGEFKSLATRVLAAIPGLWGYVGIDFIVTRHGPIVLEVNPRMTVSHVGLRASLGFNPIQIMLDTVNGGEGFVPATGKNRQISVDIGARQSSRHVIE